MYCPRCGTPNEPGDRYCSACGAILREAEGAQRQTTTRERIVGLVGTTRRVRWLTAATALAIGIAVASFVALQTDDEIPRDEYTLAAEALCLDAKRQMRAVGRLAREGSGREGASEYARGLLPAVSAWRLGLSELEAPSDRESEAAALLAALREAEVRIAALARVAESENSRRTRAAAASADDASTSVEESVAGLGLDECAALRLGTAPG